MVSKPWDHSEAKKLSPMQVALFLRLTISPCPYLAIGMLWPVTSIVPAGFAAGFLGRCTPRVFLWLDQGHREVAAWQNAKPCSQQGGFSLHTGSGLQSGQWRYLILSFIWWLPVSKVALITAGSLWGERGTVQQAMVTPHLPAFLTLFCKFTP